MNRLASLAVLLLLAAPAWSQRPIVKGSIEATTYIRIVDSVDGTPETGVVAATGGLDLEYVRLGATPVDLTEADLGAMNSAHSDGGIIHVGGGRYRVDLPDAAVASAAGINEVAVQGTVTGMIVIPSTYPLVAVDPFDSVRMGLTALPNVASGSAGAIITSGTGTAQLSVTSGVASANVTQISGDSVAADNLETMLDGTGGQTLSLGAIVVNNASGSAVTLTSSGSNGSGLVATGNGTGSGLLATGGATAGSGFRLLGGTTGGSGLLAVGGAVSGDGIVAATTLGDGIDISSDEGEGLRIAGGVSGRGASITAGEDAVSGLSIIGGANSGDALRLLAGTGDALEMLVSANGTGLKITGASLGDGINVVAGVTGGDALELDGDDTGDDLKLTGTDAPTLANLIWNELKSAHTVADSFGDYLDDEISQVSGGAGTYYGLLQSTTITVTSPTVFVLAAGPTNDDALNEATAVLINAAGTQKDKVPILDYVGATKTVTLTRAPRFMIATGDTANVLVDSSAKIAEAVVPYAGSELEADIAAFGLAAAVSPFNVDEDHTWTFNDRQETTSAKIIVEVIGFENALVAMDFTEPMPAGVVIGSITSVTIADVAGKTEPTVESSAISADKKEAHIKLDTAAASAGTYTCTVKIVTTDNQTYTRKGQLTMVAP